MWRNKERNAIIFGTTGTTHALHKERFLLFESSLGKNANKKLAKKYPNRYNKST